MASVKGSELPTCQSHYKISDRDFKTICRLVYDLAGIHLHEGKRELVTSRLAKRVRALGLTSLGNYLAYVQEQKTQEELIKMLDALTTNLTRFWRESEHFNFLIENLIPGWHQQAEKSGNRKLRLWSAGCSTGEEPYGIAMLLREYFEIRKNYDIKVLATDLSTKVLATAKAGSYRKDRINDVPIGIRRKYFVAEKQKSESFYTVHPQIRSMVSFERLNLMDSWPMRGPFDFIFCRNVMIYFDKPTQKKLIDRFHSLLKSKGVLFVGHSESLAGISHSFHYLRPTIYEKS